MQEDQEAPAVAVLMSRNTCKETRIHVVSAPDRQTCWRFGGGGGGVGALFMHGHPQCLPPQAARQHRHYDATTRHFPRSHTVHEHRGCRDAPRASGGRYVVVQWTPFWKAGRDAVAEGVCMQQRSPPLQTPHPDGVDGCSCPHPLPRRPFCLRYKWSHGSHTPHERDV